MLLIFVLTNMNKHVWFMLVIFKHERADSAFAAGIFRNWTLTCSMYVSLTRTTSYNLEIRRGVSSNHFKSSMFMCSKIV